MRVAGALSSRLGAAALLMSTPAVAVAKKSLFSSQLSLTVASAGLVVAGATYWWTQPPATEAVHAPSVDQHQVAAMAPAPVPEAIEEASSPDSPRPATPSIAPAPAPASPAKAVQTDRLGEEVGILSRAMTVLRGGNPAEALRLLDTHRQQFPTGRLVEERRAARVQALCALGRRSEGEAELSRLERSAPKSPHVARAKRACGLN